VTGGDSVGELASLAGFLGAVEYSYTYLLTYLTVVIAVIWASRSRNVLADFLKSLLFFLQYLEIFWKSLIVFYGFSTML